MKALRQDSVAASKKVHRLRWGRRWFSLGASVCALSTASSAGRAGSWHEQLSPSYLKKDLSGKKEPREFFLWPLKFFLG